ncbi:MAG TPA: GNAT family N-acetyltransferase [Gaiellaceae bacterium]|nr:GNAT family N-acetyltransferase [Gaiellaceae bacterium]
MQLRDEELLLRPPTEADAPAVTAACQDPELARFIPGFPSPMPRNMPAPGSRPADERERLEPF